ncbi:MAG: phosphatidylglycerophosphatase A [Nitrospiraceae bacterium]|nr:phosphatidylglycerophosphatase A [Nitrospiraceae bacterium]
MPGGKSSRPLKWTATLLGLGYVPFAPGTFGTAAAAIFTWAARPGMYALLAITVIVTVFGAVAAGNAEKELGKDSSRIIIDEVAGYLTTVLFLPLSLGVIIWAFVLFRLFDILKPPPINLLERLPGGIGVMADDIGAGVFANTVLRAATLYWGARLGIG